MEYEFKENLKDANSYVVLRTLKRFRLVYLNINDFLKHCLKDI